MHTRSSANKKASAKASAAPPSNALTPHPFAAQPAPEPLVAEATSSEAQLTDSPGPIFSNGSVLQPKLTIGAVGDPYEQEADRVAQEVVQRIHSPQPDQNLQRHGDEEDLQRKPDLQRHGDEEELQRKPDLQRHGDEEELQRKPDLQRHGDEEELQRKPQLQLRANTEAADAQPELESAIQRSKGSGTPLGDSILGPMEQAFQANFKGVRVHTNSEADSLNRSIQAKAFTTGQDIFFREGEYQPSSRSGQELLAHELTHVVQQNGSAVQRHQDEDALQMKADVRLQRTSNPCTAGCSCSTCAPSSATIQRQVSINRAAGSPTLLSRKLSDAVSTNNLKIQRRSSSGDHSQACQCSTCGTPNISIQRKASSKNVQRKQAQPSLAASGPKIQNSLANSNRIQRHASWEHKLIGDLDPEELAILGTGRNLKALEDGGEEDATVKFEGQDIKKENVLHLLKQEINRLAVFQKSPPKPWSGTDSSKEDEERKLREASFERSLKTNEQLLRDESLLGLGKDSQRSELASPKTAADNIDEKEDAQWQVELLEIKSDYVGKAKHKTIVVTYGEMNTLADFYGSMNELKKTDPDSLYAIVQGVRQESLKKLTKLYGEISGIISTSSEEASGRHIINSKVREYQKGKTESALGLDTTDFEDAAPVGNVTAELQQMRAGGLGMFSNKKKQIDEGIFSKGDESTAYKATLARNACHFAPESWLSWADYHEKAREMATRAAASEAEANKLNAEAQETENMGYDALAAPVRNHALTKLEEKEKLANEALVTNGFGDHYLQDSYAGGHLINKTQIMMFFTEWMDRQEKLMDGVLDKEWRKIQEVAYNQKGIVSEDQYDKTKVGETREIEVDGEEQSVSRAKNPQSIENIEGDWKTKFAALGLTLPSSMTDPSTPAFRLLIWWQEQAMKAKTSARTKSLKDLQKSGLTYYEVVDAAYQLIDDRIARFDDSDKSGNYKDPSWIGSQKPEVIKVVLRDDYVPRTNVFSKSDSEVKFAAMKQDYETAKTTGDFTAFKESQSFQDYQDQGRAVGYNNYLAFMKSSYLQASTNVLHDKFCKGGLDVYPDNGSDRVFKVYGDDSMLQKGSAEGLKHSGETAKMSKNAIVGLIQGQAVPTTKAIAARFPSWVKPEGSDQKVSLAEWHNGGGLKKLCFDSVFPEMPNLKKLAGVFGGDLGKISKDEDTHKGEMF